MGQLTRLIIKQGNASQRARILGMIVAFLIVVILIGIVVMSVLNSISNGNTPHKGLYFSIENATFIHHSSGSYYFITSVKNTGSVFIGTIHITITETGSMIDTLTSIPVGKTANATIAVSGVTNNSLYALEYNATTGNLSYTITHLVLT